MRKYDDNYYKCSFMSLMLKEHDMIHIKYKDEIENFIGMIRGEKQRQVCIDEAIQVMMILEAIKTSHREGKKIAVNDLIPT